MGYLLILDFWTPLTHIKDISLFLCAFWLQFHGLPREGMMRKNCVKMGSRAGIVMAIEDLIGISSTSRGLCGSEYRWT